MEKVTRSIWPKVNVIHGLIGGSTIEETQDVIKLQTYIRKQGRDGKWYLSFLTKHSTGSSIELFKQFVAEAYNAQVFGMPVPNMNEDFSFGSWVMDENQEPEEVRLQCLEQVKS